MALVLARAPFLKRGASQQRSDAALSALRERQRWTSALGDGRYGGARGCTRAPQQGVALSNANVALRDLDYVNPRQPLPSHAQPPEVRRAQGLTARSAPGGGGHDAVSCLVYSARGARVLSGASRAGTNWRNAAGHAYVRAGTASLRAEELRRRRMAERQLAAGA